jgi:hypothetical protein
MKKVSEPKSKQAYVNLTTGEYIENFTISQLKSLLKKKTKETADFGADIGESHWKRSDKIVISPLHCETFVRNFYTKLDLN